MQWVMKGLIRHEGSEEMDPYWGQQAVMSAEPQFLVDC